MSDEEYDEDESDVDYGDEESEEESESPSEKLEMTYHAIRQLRKTGTSDKMLQMMGYSPEDIENAFKEPEEDEDGEDTYDEEAEYKREMEERRQLLEEERLEQEREKQRQQQMEVEAEERKRQYILQEQQREKEQEERKRQFIQEQQDKRHEKTPTPTTTTTPEDDQPSPPHLKEEEPTTVPQNDATPATTTSAGNDDPPKFQRRLGRRRTQEHVSFPRHAVQTLPGVPVKAYYHFQEQDLHHMEIKLSGSTNIRELTNLLRDNQELKEGVQKLTLYVEETFTFFQAEVYVPLFQAISELPAVQNLYLHYFGPLEKFPMTEFQEALRKKTKQAEGTDGGDGAAEEGAAAEQDTEENNGIQKMETSTVKLTGKVKELDMRRQWIDTVSRVSSDLSCIYYFMRRNPLLCDVNYINGVEGYDPYELDDEQVNEDQEG